MSGSSLLVIACVAGIAVALQGQAMGALNRGAGTATTTLLTYGSGAAISALFWLFRRPANAVAIAGTWWYGVVAGMLGLVIVGGIGYAAPRLGLTRTLVVTVAAQLITAVVLEQFGWFGAAPRALDAGKAIGIVLTVAGVWLTVR